MTAVFVKSTVCLNKLSCENLPWLGVLLNGRVLFSPFMEAAQLINGKADGKTVIFILR